MRTITNTGDPLEAPDGTAQSGVSVVFTLVDGAGIAVTAFNVNTHEYVMNVVEAATDGNGEFSVSLHPNDELAGDTYYHVTISPALGYSPFKAKLLAGSGAVSFHDFYTSGQTLTSAEVSNLATHVQDTQKHLTPDEDAALAGANAPSAANPVATMGDLGDGAFTGLSDTPADYAGQAGRFPRVKATEDGLEFVTGTSSGEANTASNIGTGGVGLFKQKAGEDLQFRNINAASAKVTVADDAVNNEVDIDVVETQINHNALTNYSADEHRRINDAATGITDLWSADKINTELSGKSGATHDHDADYAPIAKGVTGGDAHDHSGGDGAQIDHAALSSIGTNTHAQIDTHIADTANPHAVTKAQAGLGNVENLKVNLTAVSAPTATDDSSAGYSVGSRWVDVSADKEYVCLDATATAAVWTETTQSGGSVMAGEYLRCGFDWGSATTVKINSGYYELGGVMREVTSQLTFTFGPGGSNPDSSALGASQWHYFYLDASAIGSNTTLTAAMFLNSTTAPSYDQAKRGHYNGSDRCVFAFRTDGAGQIKEFSHGGDRVRYNESINVALGLTPSTTWTDVTLTIPAISSAGDITLNTYYVDADAGVYIRPNGTSGGGNFVDKARTDNQYSTNPAIAYTDSSQIIEVCMSVATSDQVNIYTQGWFLPEGM
ncbi:MAG: hypothetical protein ACNS63_10825 [Candidatus Nitrospinota bacterium M3_3B_026]